MRFGYRQEPDNLEGKNGKMCLDFVQVSRVSRCHVFQEYLFKAHLFELLEKYLTM